MSIINNLANIRIARYFRLIFVLWDLLLLNVAIIISLWLRYGSFNRINVKEFQTISLISIIFWIIILFNKEVYRTIRLERIETLLYRMIRHILIHAALIAIFITLLKYQGISRLRLLYFYGSFFSLLFISRIAMMQFLKSIRAKGYNFKTILIIGANAKGERMNRILSKDITSGYKICGFFDDETDGTELNAPLLGNFDAVEQYLLENQVDEMFVALDIDQVDVINKMTRLCDRYMVRVRYIPDFQQYTKANRVQISFYGNGNVPVLMLRKEPLEININRISKQLFDFVFSLMVIVLLFSWLFPILILIIKLNSPGPAFFVQSRSGRDNEPFPCFKFRTMYVNKEANKLQATKNDARITKVGAFLRKTSLDELPQFFNVLLGNMSVVGPRPHMLSHTQEYSELIDNFLVRHYAKPGITGWAQINGYRGETKYLKDMQGRVEYDIWYIENWSLLLDVRIIWKTFIQVFEGDKKAY